LLCVYKDTRCTKIHATRVFRPKSKQPQIVYHKALSLAIRNMRSRMWLYGISQRVIQENPMKSATSVPQKYPQKLQLRGYFLQGTMCLAGM
jgi:hypothetical protein